MTDNVYDPIGWRFCVAPMLDLTIAIADTFIVCFLIVLDFTPRW